MDFFRRKKTKINLFLVKKAFTYLRKKSKYISLVNECCCVYIFVCDFFIEKDLFIVVG
ncbi:Hypothetical protein ETEE_0973 [Edwardsiella anguillarum ET080813]|uniref:Uncharacterized protein n=1 Tax=Edwardsiella anguillarum ET080813 TaxID=667120 RepID=A0A076LL24_9GAMM|nr:Hypothetical protein ETEE_0973 [Edwardsiella anguillarum ET080813]